MNPLGEALTPWALHLGPFRAPHRLAGHRWEGCTPGLDSRLYGLILGTVSYVNGAKALARLDANANTAMIGTTPLIVRALRKPWESREDFEAYWATLTFRGPITLEAAQSIALDLFSLRDYRGLAGRSWVDCEDVLMTLARGIWLVHNDTFAV